LVTVSGLTNTQPIFVYSSLTLALCEKSPAADDLVLEPEKSLKRRIIPNNEFKVTKCKGRVTKAWTVGPKYFTFESASRRAYTMGFSDVLSRLSAQPTSASVRRRYIKGALPSRTRGRV